MEEWAHGRELKSRGWQHQVHSTIVDDAKRERFTTCVETGDEEREHGRVGAW